MTTAGDLDDARQNRAVWDALSDGYQEHNEATLASGDLTWGVWALPEDDLGVLGELAGRRVLDLGCGAAQWTVALSARGADAVGLEVSAQQLAHARATVARASRRVPLVQATAERLPFRDGAFDVVGCDWGAMTFADPLRTVPECARVLRPGGVLAFVTGSPLDWLALDPTTGERTQHFARPYFGMHRWVAPEGTVEFQLPFGEWVALFRRNGLVVEQLLEPSPPPDAVSTYRTAQDREWGRRWPLEALWKVRKA